MQARRFQPRSGKPLAPVRFRRAFVSTTETHPPASRSALRRLAGAVRWSFAFDLYDVFIREVLTSDAKFHPPEGYAFRFGTPEDLERCTPYHTELGERDRNHGQLRLDVGHRLVVGLADQLPVFTMWINPRNLNVPGELKRRLEETQVFIYKAFTSPDHRGRKLYQAGMAFVLADLVATGGTELVGYAHLQKRASRGGLARLGFSSCGTYRVLGFRSLRRVLVSRQLHSKFPEAVPRSHRNWT